MRAIRNIEINVTDEHIESAQGSWDSNSCPIALAMYDAGLDACRAEYGDLGFTLDGIDYEYPTPDVAEYFMDVHDSEQRAAPITFTVSTRYPVD